MVYILCLETSTTNCSVSLADQNGLIACIEDYSTKYSHAERLHNFIDQILKENNIATADLAAVAVSKGPGSYTGLRIGVSAAKGLCYALDIPLISVPTLQSLSMQVTADDGVIIPMIDARRMEVYAAVFSTDYKELRETKAQILDENTFAEYLAKGKVYFIGNGVDKFAEICKHPNAVFIKEKLPSSKEMTVVCFNKFLRNEFEDVSYFEPYYLKDFVTG